MESIHEIKKKLQNHFTDGLLIIVGSGLSAAEGIPGMGGIASHLRQEIPKNTDETVTSKWRVVETMLQQGKTLEEALGEQAVEPELLKHISISVANLIRSSERRVISEVFEGQRTLRFSKLLPHLVSPKTGIPIITTNYDRLIEVATEDAGIGCDTSFVGHVLGRPAEKESAWSFCRGVRMGSRKTAIPQFAKKALVAKPHGSLDWYLKGEKPIRSSIDLPQRPLIITPGYHKYRAGYDQPFDLHRSKANKLIDEASRFLIIGYGFNDDHLQTHLEPRIRAGVPTLLLTQSLSSNAERIVKEAPRIVALSQGTTPKDSSKTMLSSCDDVDELADCAIWDLSDFVEEVMG